MTLYSLLVSEQKSSGMKWRFDRNILDLKKNRISAKIHIPQRARPMSWTIHSGFCKVNNAYATPNGLNRFQKILRMVLHTSFSIDRIMRVQHLRSLVAPSLLLLLPTWMHRHLQLEQGRINLLPWQGSANQKLLIWPIPLSDSKWRSFYSYRKEFESEHGRSMCYRLNLLKIRSPHGLHNSDCAIIWCQAKIN